MPDGLVVYIPSPSIASLDFIADRSTERHFPRPIERRGCIGGMERVLPLLFCLPALIAFLGIGTDWYGVTDRCEQIQTGPAFDEPIAPSAGKFQEDAPKTENHVIYNTGPGNSSLFFFCLFSAVVLVLHGIKMSRDKSHPAANRPALPSTPSDDL